MYQVLIIKLNLFNPEYSFNLF